MSTATLTMRPKRNDVAVKIDAYVLKLARILAAYEDETIAKILSDAMKPILQKRLDKLGVPYPAEPEKPAD